LESGNRDEDGTSGLADPLREATSSEILEIGQADSCRNSRSIASSQARSI
jgi:hypothetical protein